MNVFISYRRADSLSIAGRIKDKLESIFDDAEVFLDSYSIPPGSNFLAHINQQIRTADIMFVLIGPHWATPTLASFTSRLLQPEDVVYSEIEIALTFDTPIIPVLLPGGNFPTPHQLPVTARPFLYLNAARLRPDPDFPGDFRALLRAAFKATGSDSIASIQSTDLHQRMIEHELFPGESLFCGRSPDCEIQLTSDVVGRRHACLTLLRNSLLIDDLESRNGIYLNGKRVNRAYLRTGDSIRFGKSGPVIKVAHAPESSSETRLER